MNNDIEKQPSFESKSFYCPLCDVFAHQSCKELNSYQSKGGGITRVLPHDTKNLRGVYISICASCELFSIWFEEKMVYPKKLTVPLAHRDMSAPVKELYEEARQISNDSPRAAAALLRVTLEKLTEELGEKEGNLNTRIGNLHKRGLAQEIINSLDIVRISANEGGSHAGQIDLTGEDGAEIVNTLFWLVNIIVEKTISEPKEIEENFSKLPQSKKDGVKNRDLEP